MYAWVTVESDEAAVVDREPLGREVGDCGDAEMDARASACWTGEEIAESDDGCSCGVAEEYFGSVEASALGAEPVVWAEEPGLLLDS